MTIEEIKSVSLVAYLKYLGHFPVRQSNGKYWYLSPLHAETSASFKVNTNLNLWYDHALSKGGNIINLASNLYPYKSMHEILTMLSTEIKNNKIEYESYSENTGSNHFMKCPKKVNIINIEGTKILRVSKITNPNLLAYLAQRQIPVQIANSYCKEIHYSDNPSGKIYYGIAFPNSRNGYEVRNKYNKRCIGHKSYTMLLNDNSRCSTCCCIFEGFFDFLSLIALRNEYISENFVKQDTDYIILNSIITISQLHDILPRYETIYCFLDNDSSGRETVEKLYKVYHGKISDQSFLYKNNKDLNDYLIVRKQLFPLNDLL